MHKQNNLAGQQKTVRRFFVLSRSYLFVIIIVFFVENC